MKKMEDVKEYVKVKRDKGEQIILAEKTARISATKGVIDQQVISWSVDAQGHPLQEKVAIVSVDENTGELDWIATKVDECGEPTIDQNGNQNQWIITDKVLQQKYQEVPKIKGLFQPIGGVQQFLLLKEAITIWQWGEQWQVDAGGYINITNESDIYVISQKDFEDTYRIVM